MGWYETQTQPRRKSCLQVIIAISILPQNARRIGNVYGTHGRRFGEIFNFDSSL